MKPLTLSALIVVLCVSMGLAQKTYDFSKESEELSVPGETVQQAAEKTAAVLQQSQMKMTISTVGFDIAAGSEAEKALQETARIGGGGYFTASDTGQLSAALGAAASGQTGVPQTAPGTVVLTAPRNGDVVGPNIDVVGKAGPGEVVLIFTTVYDADTGEKLRTVPGIRNRAKETGDFSFRIATPRVSFSGGQAPPPLRYEVHAQVIRADGTSGPETVVNMVGPKP